jgi:sugar phosphate permease
LKFFYGWVVLGALFLVFFAGNIGVSILPFLNAELRQTFKWTHRQITAPPSYSYFYIALFSPIIGLILDRFSPRLVLSIGCIGIGLSVLAYYYIRNIAHLHQIYLLYALALTAAGQITGVYILVQWFNKYRGLAIGIFFMGSSFGGIVFSPLTAYLIKAYQWQGAALILGSILLLIFLLAGLLVRNRPQDLGLSADGLPPAQGSLQDLATKNALFPDNQSIRLSNYFKSLPFYLILIITGALSFCIYSLIQHLRYFLQDLKLDLVTAGWVTSLFFGCSLVGKLGFGYLGDRFSKKYIMFLAGLNMCLGSLLLRFTLDSPAIFLFPTIMAYGIGYSGTLTMIQLLVAEYYQGKFYGTMLGIITFFDTLAASFGIMILGNMRSQSNSYQSAFELLLWVSLVSTVAILFLRKQNSKYITN